MNKLYKQRNFYPLITMLTITIMFFVISHISENYREEVNKNFLSALSALVVSLILSSGLFTTFSIVLSYLFENIKWMKALILGKQYLEGFWIGYIEGETEVSYVEEKIEQSFDEVYLNGVSYRLSENNELLPTSSWMATVVKIMNKESEFHYTYLNSNFEKGDKVSQFTGFAKFHYETFSKDNNEFLKAQKLDLPLLKSCSMYGQLMDFTPEGEKLLAIEMKLTDSLEYDIDYFKKYAYNFLGIPTENFAS